MMKLSCAIGSRRAIPAARPCRGFAGRWRVFQTTRRLFPDTLNPFYALLNSGVCEIATTVDHQRIN